MKHTKIIQIPSYLITVFIIRTAIEIVLEVTKQMLSLMHVLENL
jgi:hypothetical protein